MDSCITSVSELIGDDMKAATYRSPNCIKKTDKQTKGQTDRQHQCIKSSLTPPALPPLGHIGDVVLVWRKESINKTVSMLHIMYYYNGAQRYEQFFQVYRLYRFLILLGLTLCLPSTSVSLVFMMLYWWLTAQRWYVQKTFLEKIAKIQRSYVALCGHVTFVHMTLARTMTICWQNHDNSSCKQNVIFYPITGNKYAALLCYK